MVPVSVRNISYGYDVLDRLTSVENFDGSVRNTSHMHWVLNHRDEEGNRLRYFLDAFGRVKQVDEFNGGMIYSTFYSYDGLGNLVNITDNEENIFFFVFDSLGRQVKLVDPDLGV